jgi:hypothetical protein
MKIEELPGQNLSLRQAKFVRYMVELGDSTQAAIKAGYSENGARQCGERLLRLSAVSECLTAAGKTARHRVANEVEAGIASEEWIVAELVAIVRSGKQDRDKLAALSLLSRRIASWHTPTLAITSNNLVLPEGTELSEIRELAASLRERLPVPG